MFNNPILILGRHRLGDHLSGRRRTGTTKRRADGTKACLDGAERPEERGGVHVTHVPDLETAGVVHDTGADREVSGVLADAADVQRIGVRVRTVVTQSLCSTLADHQLDPTGGLHTADRTASPSTR